MARSSPTPRLLPGNRGEPLPPFDCRHSVGELSRLWVSGSSTRKRWGTQSLCRELPLLPQNAMLLAPTLGRCGPCQVAWHFMEPVVDLHLSLLPAQGWWIGYLLDRSPLGPWERVRREHRCPPCWGEGFLFSVPAVFLLFNLNTQTSMQLHPCEWEGPPQLGPVGCLGDLLRLHSSRAPSSCSLLPGDTAEQSWGPGS